MFLVKSFTNLLEFTAQRKLKKSEKRSRKAIRGMKKAKRRYDAATHSSRVTQASVLMQLNRLDKTQKEVAAAAAVTEGKSTKLGKLISDLHTEG